MTPRDRTRWLATVAVLFLASLGSTTANAAAASDAGAGDAASRTLVSSNAAGTDTFQNEILATGFALPTTFEFLPDGRMLVGELQGKIKVLPPPYTQPDSTLFLQI